VEPRYAFEVNDTRTLLDLVEIGLGVAVFPEALAAPRGAQLREIAISGRRWDWTVRAEALAPGPSNPAARALWTMRADPKTDAGRRLTERKACALMDWHSAHCPQQQCPPEGGQT
jgi:DNA-binding transcriptional LysR family regulator